MLSSVEFLGPATLQVLIAWTYNTPVFKPDRFEQAFSYSSEKELLTRSGAVYKCIRLSYRGPYSKAVACGEERGGERSGETWEY